MPGIKIVSHCYALTDKKYATMLRAQISSLIVNPTRVPITLEVYRSISDANVDAVLGDFLDDPRDNLSIRAVRMADPWLWRRSIGRNQACRSDVDSDLIWFCDCDYLFGPESLDSVHSFWSALGKPGYAWPRSYISAKVEITEAWLAECSDARGLLYPLELMDQSKSAHAKYKFIGGLQIVAGDYARRRGYLKDVPQWQSPASRPYPDFLEDVRFRRQVESDCDKGAALLIPNLYRIRHAGTGVVAVNRGR